MRTTSAFVPWAVLCLVLGISARAGAGEGRKSDLFPEGTKARAAALAASSGIDTTWRRARDRAVARSINPDDYECGPTAFDAWLGAKFDAIGDWGAFLDVLSLGAADWPAYYTLFWDTNAADDTIGVRGQLTREMVKRHKDNQRFWDVPTGDVLLQGMHGADLASDAKMLPVVEWYWGIDAGLAQELIDYVQSVIEADPGLGYDHPIWTLNAFAFGGGAEYVPGLGVTPDKIVMGDGILAALSDLGLGANAPDYVHAHEFAHEVQYELHVYDGLPGTPENGRRTELMADAFAAYYCAHPRGASFQAKRVVDTLSAAYLVGDCAFDDPGHHGTPNQRRAAAQWGADLAAAAAKKGKVNPAATMLALFDAKLPDLVAPDAP